MLYSTLYRSNQNIPGQSKYGRPEVLCLVLRPGGGDTPYDSLYGEAPPVRGTFFRLQLYKRVGILLVEVYERVGKSVIWVCKRNLHNSCYRVSLLRKTRSFREYSARSQWIPRQTLEMNCIVVRSVKMKTKRTVCDYENA